MVVGNGMIAQAFSTYQDDDRVLIFASGVSDSTNSQLSDFIREKNLLLDQINKYSAATLVYFSTCSVYDESLQNSSYVFHKLEMEEIIRGNAESFIIFRLSNPVGYTRNTNTLVNFLFHHIQQGKHFEAWVNASRNVIDMDHVVLACNRIINQEVYRNRIINVANPTNYNVRYLISALESHLGSKGNYTLVEKGGSPAIDTEIVGSIFADQKVSFDDSYLPLLLKKYFPVA